MNQFYSASQWPLEGGLTEVRELTYQLCVYRVCNTCATLRSLPYEVCRGKRWSRVKTLPESINCLPKKLDDHWPIHCHSAEGQSPEEQSFSSKCSHRTSAMFTLLTMCFKPPSASVVRLYNTLESRVWTVCFVLKTRLSNNFKTIWPTRLRLESFQVLPNRQLQPFAYA